MGLINPRRSVLQDWVMELPLREQGTLLTCLRFSPETTREDVTHQRIEERWG